MDKIILPYLCSSHYDFDNKDYACALNCNLYVTLHIREKYSPWNKINSGLLNDDQIERKYEMTKKMKIRSN